MSPTEGTLAPDFSLRDESGGAFSLSEARAGKKLALVFYRGDWCPYCNGQLMTYARRAEEFKARGGGLVGISVDSPEQNAAMVAKLVLPFPLLSDPEGDVIRRYEVWDEKETIARPSTFVLDREGLVRFVHVAIDYADRPATGSVLDALEAAD